MTDDADALGYNIMYLGILLPVATFVISLLIGKNNYWGKWKWGSAFIFGIMYMFAEYATFSTANMITFDKFNVPDFGMILAGMIISIIGMEIGALINYVTYSRRS